MAVLSKHLYRRCKCLVDSRIVWKYAWLNSTQFLETTLSAFGFYSKRQNLVYQFIVTLKSDVYPGKLQHSENRCSYINNTSPQNYSHVFALSLQLLKYLSDDGQD
jgi:hypothetical protein